MLNHHHTPKSSRQQTINSFFNKSKDQSISETSISGRSLDEPRTSKFQRLEFKKIDVSFERNPGLRKLIWMYDVNQPNKVRRTYIDMGQFQPKLNEYKKTFDGKQNQRFQYSWFTLNEDIQRVCLDNALGNTSPEIKKGILKILANEVRKTIREEIGNDNFCIFVDNHFMNLIKSKWPSC